ncbi:hypothetical protein ACLB2K_067211 [Fragaria x ananassa]
MKYIELEKQKDSKSIRLEQKGVPDAALNPSYDVVVAIDMVYIEETMGQLISTPEAMVKGDDAVLLGYQLGSPETHKLFWEMCEGGVCDRETCAKRNRKSDSSHAQVFQTCCFDVK